MCGHYSDQMYDMNTWEEANEDDPDNEEEENIPSLVDCDIEFQHFSETFDENVKCQNVSSSAFQYLEPVSFLDGFNDNYRKRRRISSNEINPKYDFITRSAPLSSFPSIQSILKVTGTVDIDKFNKGFAEGIKVDSEVATPEDVKASKKLKPSKQIQDKHEPEENTFPVEEKKILNSRKPLSLWFKKQLVITEVKQSGLDVSTYGYSGIVTSYLSLIITSFGQCTVHYGYFRQQVALFAISYK